MKLQFIHWDLCIYSLVGKSQCHVLLPHLLAISRVVDGHVYKGNMVDTIYMTFQRIWQSPSPKEEWVSPRFLYSYRKGCSPGSPRTRISCKVSGLTPCETCHSLLTPEELWATSLPWITPAFATAPFNIHAVSLTGFSAFLYLTMLYYFCWIWYVNAVLKGNVFSAWSVFSSGDIFKAVRRSNGYLIWKSHCYSQSSNWYFKGYGYLFLFSCVLRFINKDLIALWIAVPEGTNLKCLEWRDCVIGTSGEKPREEK